MPNLPIGDLVHYRGRSRLPNYVGGRRPLSPPYLTGLLAWWMADKGCKTSVPAACVDGDTVQTIDDQSGNGYTLTLNAGTPIFNVNACNGLPGVWFDGSSKFTNTSVMAAANFGSNVGSLVVFYRPFTASYFVCQTGTAGDGNWRFSGDTNGYFGDFRTARLTSYPTAMPRWGNVIGAVSSGAAGSNYFARINRATKASQTVSWGLAGSNTITMGAAGSGNLTGYIFEYLLYNVALTEAQIIQDEAYFNSKWGI